MVAMVAPCLLWSIASTCACFESVRRVLFDGSFLRDMVRILVGLKRPLRRHHRSPAQAMEPAGRDPGRAFGAPRSGTTDAPFPEEVQSFPDNFSARLRPGPWTMPEVERRPGNYLGDYPSPHHLTASAASRPNLSIASGQALLQAAQAVWLI